MATTTNRLNRYPIGTDPANVPSDIQNLANDLDNVANIFSGTLASRPAASGSAGHGAGSPGSWWYATDTGEIFVSFGAAWIKVTTEPGIPLGGMIDYAGTGDPADTRWLLADGRALARTGQYAPLFAAISTAYGVGDGSTTFNIPDKRGRVSVGQDNMGTAAGAAGRLPNSNRVIGQINGEERHAMTSAENGLHNHPPLTATGPTFGAITRFAISEPGVSAQAVAGPGIAVALTDATTGNSGSGTPHNTMQPGQCDNKLVRVK